MLSSKKYKFSLNTPFSEITDSGVKAILYGIKDKLKVYLQTAGICKVCKIDFIGIVNFIDEQSKQLYVKSIERWAAKYMSELDCKSCGGTRLNIESSNFKIDGKSINEVSNIDISTFNGIFFPKSVCLTLQWRMIFQFTENKKCLGIFLAFE